VQFPVLEPDSCWLPHATTFVWCIPREGPDTWCNPMCCSLTASGSQLHRRLYGVYQDSGQTPMHKHAHMLMAQIHVLTHLALLTQKVVLLASSMLSMHTSYTAFTSTCKEGRNEF
jgi:hypothetical protein